MKFWNYSRTLVTKNVLGMMMVLGLYPLFSAMFVDQGFLEGAQWIMWLIFYFFLSVTFMLYTCTHYFFQTRQRMYALLFVNAFVGLAIVCKLIPLPLGMTLAFVIPLLSGALIAPYFGSAVGFMTILLSSLLTGSVGPWTPIQCYLMILIPGCLIWVPRRLRQNPMVLAFYGALWGIVYGFLMSLYFWPIVGAPLVQNQNQGAFIFYYLSTSFVWDLFRALGNIVFVYLLYVPFEKSMKQTMGYAFLERITR